MATQEEKRTLAILRSYVFPFSGGTLSQRPIGPRYQPYVDRQISLPTSVHGKVHGLLMLLFLCIFPIYLPVFPSQGVLGLVGVHSQPSASPA